MYKPLVLLCVLFYVVIEARPKWQFLPPKPGYIPVYIRPGDTPLEEINPDLAEAFHAFPAGRSAGKELEASQDSAEDIPAKVDTEKVNKPDEPKDQRKIDAPEPATDIAIDRRPYEKKHQEKKTKKATEITKPVERR